MNHSTPAPHTHAPSAPPAAGERELYRSRGSPLLIVLLRIERLLAIALLTAATVILNDKYLWGLDDSVVVATGAGLLALYLMYALADWLARAYVLTERRVSRTGGVFRRTTVEVPLEQVQSMLVHASLLERLLGLGTPVFTSAGAEGGGAFVWRMVRAPHQVAAKVREAIEADAARSRELAARAAHAAHAAHAAALAAGQQPRWAPPAPPAPPPPAPRPIIIGLSGGIGAGKSAAAAEFARLGCFVADSDTAGREALQRPDVASILAQWWGPGLLDAQGRVDRSRVADVVFADPAQRTRLEQLTHPIIAQHRAWVIDQATRAGAPAVIVDAPLLFEAGLDRSCDCTVFVDAPAELRRGRVASRGAGWAGEELARREAAQWPVEEKRRRSHFVIRNTGDPAALAEAARGVLGAIISQWRWQAR